MKIQLFLLSVTMWQYNKIHSHNILRDKTTEVVKIKSGSSQFKKMRKKVGDKLKKIKY